MAKSTNSEERQIPKISLHDFAERRDEIAKQIVTAAENPGFFVLVNQASPSVAEINEMFSLSEAFFSLPEEIKSETPHIKTENTGWETRSQIRPSTGVPDQKESLQLQYHRRFDGTWPTSPLLRADFHTKTAEFMQKANSLSQDILSIFAEALNFPPDLFAKAHDVESADALNTLRLLHYHDVTNTTFPEGYWRAGAHTDFDCLTLLFQRDGEAGLEVCPGRECHTSFGTGDHWTPVVPKTGEIVCNIGDMMMAWSDDRFKSLFHRVRCPKVGENQKARYSIAYFNQANKKVEIRGPQGKYPVMTAERYILDSLARNFGRLAERQRGELGEGNWVHTAAVPV